MVQSATTSSPEQQLSPDNKDQDNDWTSLENEVRIGKGYAALLDQSVLFLREGFISDYVSRIGQRLAPACEAPFPIVIKVVQADDVSAIALPGGFVYLNSALVAAAEDEAELAGAIAHQMAHICAHHLVRGMTREEFHDAAHPRTILPDSGNKTPYPGFSGLPVSVIPPLSQRFPPEFEAEADDLALQYMDKSGYDPRALVALFARLGALRKETPRSVASSFSSHLQTPERIRKANKKAKSLAPRGQYVVNSSEFNEVKARLLAITPRHAPGSGGKED